MRIISVILLSLWSFACYAAPKQMTYSEHAARLKYAEINGQQIAYVDEGQGPAVVLIHGIPTSSWMYRKLIPVLVKSGRRVIAPDLLGFGKSSRPRNRAKMLVPQQAQLMLSLLTEELKLASWTQVLHDFGGPITWEMMEDPRFAATHLVVLDTVAFNEGFDPGMNFFMRAVMRAGTGTPLINRVFFEQAFRDMVSTPKVASKTMVQGYCAPMINGGAASYRTLLFSVNDLKAEFPRYQQTIRNSHIPASILWGEQDAFLSVKTQMPLLKMAFGVADEDVIILKGAKHLVADERPEEIAAQIMKY